MKKVTTYGSDGQVNGWLMELQKAGYKTTAYLTAVKSGGFKGYHLHTVRTANYVCISGSVLVITYHKEGNKWCRREKTLHEGDTMQIGINIPTGLKCIGFEEAQIVNFPDPPYDPNHEGEQVEYTEEELNGSRMA